MMTLINEICGSNLIIFYFFNFLRTLFFYIYGWFKTVISLLSPTHLLFNLLRAFLQKTQFLTILYALLKEELMLKEDNAHDMDTKAVAIL